jgi:transcription initiation factor TFIIB
MEEDDENMQIETLVRCGECGSRNLEEDIMRGETCCIECGLVLEDTVIDQGAEWRTFGPDDQGRARTGSPATLRIHDKGLSTEIDWKNTDFSGRAISGKSRAQMYRMRKWQTRARSSGSRERNLQKALPEINRIGSRLGLASSHLEEASMIYRKAVEADMIRGRSIDALVASSIYAVCCLSKLGRTIEEVCEHSRIGRKELTRTYKLLKQRLRLRMDINRPEDYVQSFCSKLALSAKTTQRVYEIIQDATDRELVDGKSPTGVTAAAIYIACQMERQIRTQLEISKISYVTEVTIRNRYKELCKALDIKLDI